MDRPKRLRQAVEVDVVEGFRAGMVRRETPVVARVPVLRRHDQVVVALEPVDDRHDLLAARHGERAARDEIHLHIDDDQGTHPTRKLRRSA